MKEVKFVPYYIDEETRTVTTAENIEARNFFWTKTFEELEEVTSPDILNGEGPWECCTVHHRQAFAAAWDELVENALIKEMN